MPAKIQWDFSFFSGFTYLRLKIKEKGFDLEEERFIRKYNKYKPIILIYRRLGNSSDSTEKIKNRIKLEKEYDKKVV